MTIDYRQMTSPCGLDCFNCPAHLAMEDDEQRARWSEITGKPLDEAFCRGCRNEGGAISLFGRTEPCAVWTCIHGKGHEHCCECTAFPCDNLQPYADREPGDCAKLFVRSGGADLPRPITLERNGQGQYKIRECSSVYLGVRPVETPADKDF